MLGLAFVIPAYKIFDDIRSRFGEEPLLCPSPSVIQPLSAPNDGKAAEQPLLDSIQGKGTFPLIQLRDSPGAGQLLSLSSRHLIGSIGSKEKEPWPFFWVSDSPGAGKSAMAQDYARHVNFIGNGHLEEIFTKLKDIAEMIREERAEKRMANFLRTAFQEVSDTRTAFFRDYLSDRFSIMTGTFNVNELMHATFSDTAFSAKPPSFASIVPSIGAYNYTDCNRETDGYARGDETARQILVCKYFQEKHSELTFNVFRVHLLQEAPTLTLLH